MPKFPGKVLWTFSQDSYLIARDDLGNIISEDNVFIPEFFVLNTKFDNYGETSASDYS